jgi:hypothetical protein
MYDVRARRQTDYGAFGTYPNWSRNAEFLFFFSGGDMPWGRVRIRDGKRDSIGTRANLPSADPHWFSICPDDSLITARSTGTAEIYGLDLDLP